MQHKTSCLGWLGVGLGMPNAIGPLLPSHMLHQISGNSTVFSRHHAEKNRNYVFRLAVSG